MIDLGILKMIKKIIPTEYQEAVAFWAWCQLHPIVRENMIHIENERKCTPQAGVRRKKIGVKKGVSDYFLSVVVFEVACNQAGHETCQDFFHDLSGLWIELKRKDKRLSKVSKEQKDWIDLKNQQGYKALVCYGADEAIQAVKTYLKG